MSEKYQIATFTFYRSQSSLELSLVTGLKHIVYKMMTDHDFYLNAFSDVIAPKTYHGHI